ncbi:hypothetical protein M0804_011766 [Polistes exclamans]|nr:hypothetical protein M0804_011766 [Polistes exclamans]
MSDSENSNISDEIQDLENILANISTNPIYLNKSSIDETDELSQFDVNLTKQEKPGEIKIDKLQEVLALNKVLIEQLTIKRNEISEILRTCEENLLKLDELLENHEKNQKKQTKWITSIVGMPYFKDKDFFFAPPNQDAKLKAARGELQVATFEKGCSWTWKDRRKISNNVYDEIVMSVLDPTNADTEDSETEDTDLSENKFTKMLKAKDVNEIVGPPGKKQFDWLKIALTNFDQRHSADECSVMWNILLHPDINKSKWTHAEELKLKTIAKHNNCEDWDNIAKQLNTKRSGYQCFVKYTSMEYLLDLTEQPWTEEEDEKLCEVVAKCKIGNFVPWGDVASYMTCRLKSNVYFRWMFKLAPHLKKGRFTQKESEILLKGVHKYGTNFSLIASQLLPSRSTTQLMDHYQTLKGISKFNNNWTLIADMKLVNLYKKMGPNWAKIAKEFKYKNRTQLRHRYNALYKYASRGITIYEIPRSQNDTLSKVEDNEFNDEDYFIDDFSKTDIEDKIDELLIEHFQNTDNENESSMDENDDYDPDELFRDTKELYSILETLQVNMQIPDNFDFFPLSEKDKKLLYSLKAYIKSKFNKLCDSEEIQAYMLKMFGSQKIVEPKEHFIPIPFQTNLNIKKSIQKGGINYALNLNEKFILDVPMEFDTPESIINLIGGSEEQLQFDKIIALYCVENDKFKQWKINRPTNVCIKSNLNKNNNLPYSCKVKSSNPTANYQLELMQPKNTNNKSNSSGYQSDVAIDKFFDEFHLWTSSKNSYKTVVEKLDDESVVAIKPNYITLLIYRNLLKSKVISDIENILKINLDNETIGKEYKSEDAYKLLKKRLIQLFKYPILMSHLSLKELETSQESSSEVFSSVKSNKRKEMQQNRLKRKKLKVKKTHLIKFIGDNDSSSSLSTEKS